MAGEFLDSNILVYAFTTDPRAAAAQDLLERGGIVSVQGLNEFTNVARRKLGMNWEEVRDALAAIHTLVGAILPIDIDTHTDGLRNRRTPRLRYLRCADDRLGPARRLRHPVVGRHAG